MSSFRRFSDFYPFYLSEHANRISRRLHFAGTTLVLITLVTAVATHRLRMLWLMPVFGYGFAWAGHYLFEKSRPATFKHPLYSFAGDWVMYFDMLRGRVRF